MLSLYLIRATYPTRETALTLRNDTLQVSDFKEANGYSHPYARQRFLFARLWLRLLVCEELKLGLVEVKKTLTGKPQLFKYQSDCTRNDQLCYYSQTHSRDNFLFAFSDQYELGVDIESISLNRNYHGIMRLCFNKNEEKDVLLAEHSVLHFYRYWTLKEAMLKKTGTGMNAITKLPALSPSINGNLAETAEENCLTSIQFDEQTVAGITSSLLPEECKIYGVFEVANKIILEPSLTTFDVLYN